MIAEQLAAIHDAPVRQTVPDLRERLMHTPLSTVLSICRAGAGC
jgi:hypothetical protein